MMRSKPSSRLLQSPFRFFSKKTGFGTSWLNRHASDEFVRLARSQNFRSRAAFKLLEIDEKFRLLAGRWKVVDFGAAPGSWSQIAMSRLPRGAKIVGIDLVSIEPLESERGVTAEFIRGNIEDRDILKSALRLLQGPAGLLISDLAPGFSGSGAEDRSAALRLNVASLKAALEILKPGGAAVFKAFQSAEIPALFEVLKGMFSEVKRFKPDASRQESAEFFFICKGFLKGSLQKLLSDRHSISGEISHIIHENCSADHLSLQGYREIMEELLASLQIVSAQLDSAHLSLESQTRISTKELEKALREAGDDQMKRDFLFERFRDQTEVLKNLSAMLKIQETDRWKP